MCVWSGSGGGCGLGPSCELKSEARRAPSGTESPFERCRGRTWGDEGMRGWAEWCQWQALSAVTAGVGCQYGSESLEICQMISSREALSVGVWLKVRLVKLPAEVLRNDVPQNLHRCETREGIQIYIIGREYFGAWSSAKGLWFFYSLDISQLSEILLTECLAWLRK